MNYIFTGLCLKLTLKSLRKFGFWRIPNAAAKKKKKNTPLKQSMMGQTSSIQLGKQDADICSSP